MSLINISIKIAVVVALTLVFASFTKKNIYHCKQQVAPIEINQNQIVWDGEYNYDPKSSLYYGLTNDDKYLFISLKTCDEGLKQKMMMSGLTLWIDTNAKAKEQLGLIFPIAQNLHTQMNIERKFRSQPG